MYLSISLTLAISLLANTSPIPPFPQDSTTIDKYQPQSLAPNEPILEPSLTEGTSAIDIPNEQSISSSREPLSPGTPSTHLTIPLNISLSPPPASTLRPRQTTITEDPTVTIANVTFGSVNLINVPNLPGEAFLEGDSDSGGEDQGSGDANSVANGYPGNSVGVASSSFNGEGSTSGGSACTLFVCTSETSAQNSNGTSSETSGTGLINIENNAPLVGS